MRIALIALCLSAVLAWLGCRRDRDAVAWLEQKQGTVERDFAAHVGSWVGVEPKAPFHVGDGVRTGSDSTARLELSDKSKLALEPRTLVRFSTRASGGSAQRLDIETGEATLEVGSEALSLDTEIGSAVLDPFTSARLTRTEGGIRIAVAIGSAKIDSAGERVPLGQGQSREFAPPGASAKPAPTPAPVASVAPEAPSEASSADVPAAAADLTGISRGPDTFDFLASAGESLIVHDPHPPSVVGLARPESCAGAFVVELAGRTQRRIAGDKTANLELASGAHPYSVRCARVDGSFDKASAHGTMTVLADAGTRRLPSSAPATLVDTDGRKYTVLYQNLLPSITLRWTNPPSGGGFVVHESSGHGDRSITASGPSFTFAPGTLAEGSHDLSFESGGKRSKVTTVTIHFDNAAPTASLSSPAEGSFALGATVNVAGTALPGWAISVEGKDLAQDDQHRFSGQVTAPSGQRGLLIRFTNPQRGVQYYLRRAAH